MGRLRRLAGRVKQRLQGRAAVGDAFGPAQDKAFARLDDEAEAAFQLIGASVVGSWEVLLTDLARAADGALDPAEARPMLDRVSDALVPTQGPIQAAGRAYRRGLKQGVQQALQTGRLADATAPLGESLRPLPADLASGWAKTAEYITPLLAALGVEGPARTRFFAGGSELRALVERENAAYDARLAALPQAEDLGEALASALDAWQKAISRGLELFLYARRTDLVEAAARRKGGA